MYRYRSGRGNLGSRWRSYRVLVDVPILDGMRRKRGDIFGQIRACGCVQTMLSICRQWSVCIDIAPSWQCFMAADTVFHVPLFE